MLKQNKYTEKEVEKLNAIASQETQKQPKTGLWIFLAGVLAVVSVIALLGWGCECGKKPITNYIIKHDTIPAQYAKDTVKVFYKEWITTGTATVAKPDTVWIRNARMSWIQWEGITGHATIGYMNKQGMFDTTGFNAPVIGYTMFACLTDSGAKFMTVDLSEKPKLWHIATELGGGFGLCTQGQDSLKILPRFTASVGLELGQFKLRTVAFTWTPLEVEFGIPAPYISLQTKFKLLF